MRLEPLAIVALLSGLWAELYEGPFRYLRLLCFLLCLRPLRAIKASLSSDMCVACVPELVQEADRLAGEHVDELLLVSILGQVGFVDGELRGQTLIYGQLESEPLVIQGVFPHELKHFNSLGVEVLHRGEAMLRAREKSSNWLRVVRV